jgi:hypothetical protein
MKHHYHHIAHFIHDLCPRDTATHPPLANVNDELNNTNRLTVVRNVDTDPQQQQQQEPQQMQQQQQLELQAQTQKPSDVDHSGVTTVAPTAATTITSAATTIITAAATAAAVTAAAVFNKSEQTGEKVAIKVDDDKAVPEKIDYLSPIIIQSPPPYIEDGIWCKDYINKSNDDTNITTLYKIWPREMSDDKEPIPKLTKLHTQINTHVVPSNSIKSSTYLVRNT